MKKKPAKKKTYRRGAARRVKILDAAVQVIARDGTGGLTHRAVAAEADVPLASTTYYFESRDALLREAFKHLADREIAELRAGIGEHPPGLSPDYTAALWASLVAKDLADHPENIRAEMEMHLEAGREPSLLPIHREWGEAAMAYFTHGMRGAGSREPELDAALVLAVITGVQLGELADPTKRLESELLGPMLRRLIQALAAADD